MRRREFITLLGGAARVAGDGACAAAAMPVIGYFSSRSSGTEGPIRGPFLNALEESGFVAGRNVAIEYRFSEGWDERLPQIAADLVGQSVSMLVATDRPSAMAAKAATATIPIVFTSGLDPVRIGLVASFNRPGGNATGVSLFSTELGPKRLGLLRELLPKSGTIAFVVNPNNTATPFQVREMQDAAQAVGQTLLVVEAGTEEQVYKAFAMMAERNVTAILYGSNLFFQVVSEQLIALAARYRIPALYEWREFVTAGGLMSYSTDRNEIGAVSRKLCGAHFEGGEASRLASRTIVTFRARHQPQDRDMLGLEIPPTLLARADEVIE